MAYYGFAERILSRRPLPIFGDGLLLRDFTFVDDIVEAIVRLLHAPSPTPDDGGVLSPASSPIAPWRILNVGATQPVSVLAFVKQLELALGQSATLEFLPTQPGDVVKTCADTRRLQELVGFRPTTSLGAGLAKFVEWLVEYRASDNTT
jgi:UDP-glucuronate 4-epimerase